MPILFYIKTNLDTTIKTMLEILKPDVIISSNSLPSVPNITYSSNSSNQGSLKPPSLKVYNKPGVVITVNVDNKITIEGDEVQIFTPGQRQAIKTGIETNDEASDTNAEENYKNVTNNPFYDISVRADKMGRIYSKPSNLSDTSPPICLDIGNNKRYGTDLHDDIYKCLQNNNNIDLMISYIHNNIEPKIIHFLDNGKVTEKFYTSSKKENNSKGGGYKTKMSKLNFNKKKRSKKLKKYK